MTILHALDQHYGRLASAGKVPPYGFSTEKISHAVVLSREGAVTDVQSLLDTSGKKPRPSLRPVPQARKRTSGIAPNFLWDKTAYTLGMKSGADKKTPTSAPDEHEAFRAFHARVLGGTDDEGLLAFLAFLDNWSADRFASLRHAEDLLDSNVVFQLDGEEGFLHDRPAARAAWERQLSQEDGDKEVGRCLVTGELAPIATVHPAIKGVRGAQSSGASIVSFNLEAFQSLGKSQGNNSPVSVKAAHSYTSALNTLLADNRRNVLVGDTTTVFWARSSGSEAEAEAAEDLFAALFANPTGEESEAKLNETLREVARGKLPPEIKGDTFFHLLGLAPNASRLSVRYWYTDSIEAIRQKLVAHWEDLQIEPDPWKSVAPPVSALLRETAALGKFDNIPPTLGGELMRAILTGGAYPRSLLSAVITRIRADKRISGQRAAICKACLSRNHRLRPGTRAVPVALADDDTHPAYLLGRLFAAYAGIQRAALGEDMLTDRYFSAAAATPSLVFPLLERGSAHHLAVLRKDRKNPWHERTLDSIHAGLGSSLPLHLRLEDQGRFVVGYHHQKWTKRSAPSARSNGAGVPVVDEGVES